MNFRRFGHRRSLLAASGLSLALVVAACGSSSKKTSTGTSGSSQPSTSAASTSTTGAGPATLSATGNAKFGQILVDARGFTLYVFDNDTNGKVTCTGGCAQAWHALVLASGTTSPVAGQGVTAALGVVTRPDGGGTQVTLAGRPLYTFVGDTAAGQTNGDGVAGIWHVAKPAGNPVGGATTNTTHATGNGY